jgi:dolichol-phosphate mannosyltransferase
MNLNKITIVVPCYNEENYIDKLTDSLVFQCESLKLDYEIIFVEDGSSDNTFNKIKKKVKENNKIKALKLSKNYGSHVAISAGIENFDNTDLVIVCPLDDVEIGNLFSKLIEKFKEGYEIVWTTRKYRNKNFFLKIMTSIYYKMFISLTGFKNYPKNGTSAIFLISRNIANEFKKFKESNRVINVLLFSMGFKQSFVEYEENKNIRKSSYTFLKRLKIAIDSIVSYSYMPMRIISLFGIILSIFAFIFSIDVSVDYFLNDISVEGWTTVVILISLLGGIQLLTLGVLGEYLWRTSNDSKKRPLYLLEKKIGL